MTADALRRGSVASAIREHRLLAVLRRIEPRPALLALVDELADAGIRVFEITQDAPSGPDDLAAVRAHLAGRGDAACEAGADFVVTPILDLGLVRASIDAGVPIVAGAITPTEIAAAWTGGATFVKVFPAAAVGPAFVRELRGPLPEIELIPTGGVDGSNAAAFLGAGAVAVGIGGALVRATAAERRAIVAVLVGPG